MRTAHRLAAVAAAAVMITGAAFATSAVAIADPIGTASSAASATAPDIPRSCILVSQKFKVTRHDRTDLGDGAPKAWGWAHNKTGSSAMLQVQISTSSQVTYSINASVTVKTSVIFAGADATVGGGIARSHTDTLNKALTIKVPAHEFGAIGLDNIYYRFWGTYTFYYQNCKPSPVPGIFAEFPSSGPQGLEGKDIKSEPGAKPPWPVAPRG
jgi:hypothetical protein